MLVIAWFVLAPLGIFTARYCKSVDTIGGKSVPGFWFKLHRAILMLAVLLTLIGAVVGYVMVRGPHFSRLHTKASVALLVFVLLQPLNGFLRAGKDSPRRSAWRWMHKFLGYGLLPFSWAVAGTGASISGLSGMIAAVVVLAVLVMLPFALKEALRWRAGSFSMAQVNAPGGAALPAGWRKAVDPGSGRTYYIDGSTGTSQWTPPVTNTPSPPPPPPPGAPSKAEAWEELKDPATGSVYFHNRITGATAWSKPAAFV